MRKSNRTNSLVIVSDHTKSLYEDRWEGDIFHYTGMGMEGDQDLNYMQNRTLAENDRNGVGVFLFEVFNSGQYVYQGEVVLHGKPYQEVQPDANDKLRKVWVFPLKVIDSTTPVAVSEDSLLEKQTQRERAARKLTDKVLELRARFSKKGVGSRPVVSNVFERNQYVSEYVKRRAGGICQLCGKPAPFKDKSNQPFLRTLSESHFNSIGGSNFGLNSLFSKILPGRECGNK